MENVVVIKNKIYLFNFSQSSIYTLPFIIDNIYITINIINLTQLQTFLKYILNIHFLNYIDLLHILVNL